MGIVYAQGEGGAYGSFIHAVYLYCILSVCDYSKSIHTSNVFRGAHFLCLYFKTLFRIFLLRSGGQSSFSATLLIQGGPEKKPQKSIWHKPPSFLGFFRGAFCEENPKIIRNYRVVGKKKVTVKSTFFPIKHPTFLGGKKTGT